MQIVNKILDAKTAVSDSITGNRSNPNLPSELNSLFISINHQDNNELAKWTDENKGLVPPEEVKHIRMKRFTKAFSIIFEKLEFDRISEEQEVLFKKNNASVSLSDLSSGEKQIVFRGGYLLKDINALNDPVILIDEPEISLHPKWQSLIFEFYTKIFDEVDAQFFIATHSEYVVQSALVNDNQNLIYILGETEDKKITSDNLFLDTLSSAEVNYLAFGTRAIEYHNELYAAVWSVAESESSYFSAEDFDNYLVTQGIQKNRIWIWGNREMRKTLQSYIRDFYHHPENTNNDKYSDEELNQSISELQRILRPESEM